MIYGLASFLLFYALANDFDEKIAGYSGTPLSLGDQDLKVILYSDLPDFFVLFYFPQLISSKQLIEVWTEAAEKVMEIRPEVKFGVVDLSKYRRAFKKLNLDQHPSAIYTTDQFYYNFTGPFSLDNIVLTATEKKYVKLPMSVNLKPMTTMDYALRILNQVMSKDILALTLLSLIIFIIIGMVVSFYLTYCKRAPEIKDD